MQPPGHPNIHRYSSPKEQDLSQILICKHALSSKPKKKKSSHVKVFEMAVMKKERKNIFQQSGIANKYIK